MGPLFRSRPRMVGPRPVTASGHNIARHTRLFFSPLGQARRVYYGAVLDAKKVIPARMTFGLSAEMDIVAEPGKMRITLRSNPRARLIHIAVAVVAPILGLIGLGAHNLNFMLWAFVLVTLWGSLAASETIEIDNQI